MSELSAKRYQKFINHSNKGVMLHLDLETYAYYLGLYDLAKLHCIRHKCESEDLVKNINKGALKFELLFAPQYDKSDLTIYPQDALLTPSCEISNQFRQKSLKSMMEDWICWEEKTIEFLNKLEHESYEDNCDMKEFYSAQICDVQKELSMAKKLNMDMIITYYSLTESEAVIDKLLCNVL